MEDPFALLGLPRRFDIDAPALQRAFLARSAAVSAQALPSDAEEAMLADLNAAKAALEDPESRADVLLKLLGGPSREQDRSLPDGFLQQVMTVRQEMEEQLQAASGGTRRASVAKWERWCEAERVQHAARVSELFTRLLNVAGPVNTASLGAIRRELNAWRYIERMAEQIDPPAGAI